MNARDCLFFAKQSFTHGYYGHSLEWFDQALKKANQEGNTTASVDEIIPFYDVALKVVSSSFYCFIVIKILSVFLKVDLVLIFFFWKKN